MKKSLLLIGLLFLVNNIYSDTGIVLHPGLSYRSVDEPKKIIDKHIYGDMIEITGEEVNVDGTEYTTFGLNDSKYISYYYYLIDSSTQGVVKYDTYLYKHIDLSSITDEVLLPMQFVAIDKDSMNGELVKISYLKWNSVKNTGVIATGYVKKDALSTVKDDWKTGIKYFLASIEKDVTQQGKILSSIKKIHKKSFFIDRILKMMETKDLTIEIDSDNYDFIFKGTENNLINLYSGKIYKEADVNSEVLLGGNFPIKLVSKSLNPVTVKGESKYFFSVESNDVEGYIWGLK